MGLGGISVSSAREQGRKGSRAKFELRKILVTKYMCQHTSMKAVYDMYTQVPCNLSLCACFDF